MPGLKQHTPVIQLTQGAEASSHFPTFNRALGLIMCHKTTVPKRAASAYNLCWSERSLTFWNKDKNIQLL